LCVVFSVRSEMAIDLLFGLWIVINGPLLLQLCVKCFEK